MRPKALSADADRLECSLKRYGESLEMVPVALKVLLILATVSTAVATASAISFPIEQYVTHRIGWKTMLNFSLGFAWLAVIMRQPQLVLVAMLLSVFTMLFSLGEYAFRESASHRSNLLEPIRGAVRPLVSLNASVAWALGLLSPSIFKWITQVETCANPASRQFSIADLLHLTLVASIALVVPTVF